MLSPVNISSRITLLVKWKLDILRYFKDVHPLNILCILVTDEVLIFDKSILSIALQRANIEIILFNDGGLKWEKSIEIIFL